VDEQFAATVARRDEAEAALVIPASEFSGERHGRRGFDCWWWPNGRCRTDAAQVPAPQDYTDSLRLVDRRQRGRFRSGYGLTAVATINRAVARVALTLSKRISSSDALASADADPIRATANGWPPRGYTSIEAIEFGST
jgi:hypothetical protein